VRVVETGGNRFADRFFARSADECDIRIPPLLEIPSGGGEPFRGPVLGWPSGNGCDDDMRGIAGAWLLGKGHGKGGRVAGNAEIVGNVEDLINGMAVRPWGAGHGIVKQMCPLAMKGGADPLPASGGAGHTGAFQQALEIQDQVVTFLPQLPQAGCSLLDELMTGHRDDGINVGETCR
jgi:hypothetical protein